ncbi:MAG TPA: hypothetical protein VHS59_13540 [Bacillota bacterium]|nr:hypothetical protein [Bacillota bacterium]
MTKSTEALFSSQLFDLTNNYYNEMWNAFMSHVKFLNVSQQQLSVAFMNGFQKHHQAQKDQMAIFESMSDQIRQGQLKTLEAIHTNINAAVDRLGQLGFKFDPTSQGNADS